MSALKGPKKTIAVMEFENKAGADSQWQLGTGMAEMLTTALVNTGRFIVVERQAVTDVLKEQDFGASGRTTEVGAAKIGKILNSQILVRGAITEFSNQTSGGDSGIGYMGVSLGMSSSKAHVAVNIRIFDSVTGEVLDSMRCAGTAKSSGASVGYSGIVNVGGSGFAKTPLGKATQQAIDEAVAFITAKMNNVPWSGKVVSVKGDIVFINAGQNSNVNPGDEFTVYKKGEDMLDPDTGASLGCEIKKAGRIQITSVEEKFSKAKAAAGSAASFATGDIIKLD
jgi:curli biogenesis system outer membrane secretion channel CsgG